MARPKEFDRQTALDKAMNLFWLRGYEATTMTDLRRAMGIGRQSLYDTFGDKKQLFSEVLDQYVSFNDANVAEMLTNDLGIAGIRSFLDARVRMLSSGVRRGCLMMNTCVELVPHDPAVASKIQAGLITMQEGFEAALRGAIQQGQLAKNADVSNLAVFLTSQVAGMVVMAKNHASREQLQAVADLTLEALK